MPLHAVRKIMLALSAVGPGLFLIGYNIGTGSVTTMAKTGAEHGMQLLWALVLSCVFTYFLMVAYGQSYLGDWTDGAAGDSTLVLFVLSGENSSHLYSRRPDSRGVACVDGYHGDRSLTCYKRGFVLLSTSK